MKGTASAAATTHDTLMKTNLLKTALLCLSLVLITVVASAWVYLSNDGLDSVFDSTEGGCSISEVLGGNQLSRLAINDNLAVRRVIPMQFTGNFGFDYIRYAVPVAEVEKEIQEWQREPDKFQSAMSASRGYPDFKIPKWWPSPRAVVPVGFVYKENNRTEIRIWVNRQTGTFYVSTEWGH